MLKKMCIFYINGNPKSLHILKEIKYGEKGFYRSTTSISAFQSREDERLYNALIKEKILEKRTGVHLFKCWKRENENEEIFRELYKELPLYEHDDIKDFYSTIGYDIKKKKYI